MEKYDFYLTPQQIDDEAKEIMAGSWGYSAKNTAIFVVLSLIIAGLVTLFSFLTPTWYLIIIYSIVGVLLIYLLFYGFQIFCLHLSSNLKTSTKHLFAGFGKKSFRIIKLAISKFFVLIFGLCLLVFMGIKWELAYSMSAFVLYETDDKKASSSSLLKQSKRLMNGSKKRLVKVRLKNLGWMLLCLTIVGALWALPYLELKKAIMYNNLKTEF